VGWVTLGVNYSQTNNSVYAEHYFITKVESVYSVPITVLNENLYFETTVLPVEVATLFLLLSYHIPFDEDLYQTQYSVEVSEVQMRVSFYTSLLEDKLEYEIGDFCKVKELY